MSNALCGILPIFVCQFHQCGVLYSGNRISFLFSLFFCYRQQDERNRRGDPELPGRFSQQLSISVPHIPMWHGLLLKCQMLMYCRS